MGIEVFRARVPLGRDGIVDFGVEQELTQAGAGGVAPSSEDGVLLGSKDSNNVFPVEDFVAVVVE